MILKDSIIQAYLQHKPIHTAQDYTLLQNLTTPDRNRIEIVQELYHRLMKSLHAFPIFNKDLWNALFPTWKETLKDVYILPVVGLTTSIYPIQKIDGKTYIVIDLIQTANYTRIVSQMEYLLQNLLMTSLAELCIQHDYPNQPSTYLQSLDTMFFKEGLKTYLSWNKDCKFYVFQNEKYLKRKELTFAILLEAVNVTDKTTQQNILNHIQQADFWNQFPIIAGLFYFDDQYQDNDIQGIIQTYRKGPNGIILSIFTSAHTKKVM